MSKTLPQWLEYLESIHPSAIDMGLDRVNEVAQRLNLRFDSRVITVGGTNGKGSCIETMQHILLQSGYSVGAYTSPHLLHYNERIRINGQPVSDKEICQSFHRINQARGGNSLTYFEFGTLAG